MLEASHVVKCIEKAKQVRNVKELYINGTKIEANTNRYTFVWRSTINYHLSNPLDTIDAHYARYNALLSESGYDQKYGFGHAQIFIIEGMDKVREVILKNRERKLTKHIKLSNSSIIEIDSCSPLELPKLQTRLKQIAEQENILFVSGKGKKKLEIQQLYEVLEHCGNHLIGYKECFKIMGKERNSYSKTNLEATFMRMKEEHLLNSQLKLAYTVQVAVENYFIIHSYANNDRTDYHTLIPMLEKHKATF